MASRRGRRSTQKKAADAQKGSSDVEFLAKAKNIVSERERTGQGTATPERLAKAGEGGFEKNVGKESAQRMIEEPLDRLHRDGRITRSEFEAGERLRNEVYLSGESASPTSIDLTRPGGPIRRAGYVPQSLLSDRSVDASDRIQKIKRSFRGKVWEILSAAIIDGRTLEEIGRSVFGKVDKRTAVIAGDTGFRTALSALSDWYSEGR